MYIIYQSQTATSKRAFVEQLVRVSFPVSQPPYEDVPVYWHRAAEANTIRGSSSAFRVDLCNGLALVFFCLDINLSTGTNKTGKRLLRITTQWRYIKSIDMFCICM